MSLGSKIKFGLISSVIMMAVIGVGGVYLHDLRSTPGPNEDKYTFHAIFSPPKREKALTITIDLNGVRYKNTFARVSPWDLMLILPKGSRVKLEVWQSEGLTLECIIFRDQDGVIRSFPNRIIGPGGCVTKTG